MASNSVTCPSCGVEEVFDVNGERPPPIHEIGEFVCNACGTRVVYGRVIPTITAEVHLDERGLRWTRLRIKDPVTKGDVCVPIDIDPILVLRLSNNLLSLVVP